MHRIVKGVWFDGTQRRCWFKLQEKKFFFWKTIHWTTFSDTVQIWNSMYPDAEKTFDEKTFKDGELIETVLL